MKNIIKKSMPGNFSTISPVVAAVVLFSDVVCTVVVLDGVLVYTVVDVPSTVLVGASVVEGEIDVDFVVSTVVTASVVLDSVASVNR